MQGEDNDNDADGPTALIRRDALLGLIDKSVERERSGPHTVSRERLRARGSSRHGVEIVDVAPLDPAAPAAPATATSHARELDDELEPPLSPWLVLGVIALLLTVFVAVTRLR